MRVLDSAPTGQFLTFAVPPSTFRAFKGRVTSWLSATPLVVTMDRTYVTNGTDESRPTGGTASQRETADGVRRTPNAER